MASAQKNMKAAGTRRERQVRDLLKAEGALVMRAPASIGAADLIAIHPTNVFDHLLGKLSRVRLIQVKANAGSPFKNFQPKERRELLRAAQECCASVELWHWPPRGKPQILYPNEWPEGR